MTVTLTDTQGAAKNVTQLNNAASDKRLNILLQNFPLYIHT